MENERILFEIRHLNKILDIDFAKRLENYGLTPQQGRIILFVSDHYEKFEINQQMLERLWRLSKSTVSGLIKRLVQKNLILVIKEKKKHIIKPTEEGLKIRDTFFENRKLVVNKLLQGLSNEQIEILSNNINTMIKNIEKEENEP